MKGKAEGFAESDNLLQLPALSTLNLTVWNNGHADNKDKKLWTATRKACLQRFVHVNTNLGYSNSVSAHCLHVRNLHYRQTLSPKPWCTHTWLAQQQDLFLCSCPEWSALPSQAAEHLPDLQLHLQRQRCVSVHQKPEIMPFWLPLQSSKWLLVYEKQAISAWKPWGKIPVIHQSQHAHTLFAEGWMHAGMNYPRLAWPSSLLWALGSQKPWRKGMSGGLVRL